MSTFRCTGDSFSATEENASAPAFVYIAGRTPPSFTTSSISFGLGSESIRIGASIPSLRRTPASSTKATASQVAPEAKTCLATSTAPCPYPSALTTAQSSTESSNKSQKIEVFFEIVSKLISAQVGLMRNSKLSIDSHINKGFN